MVRLVRKADNLTAICEPTVYTTYGQLLARGPDAVLYVF
jgi:hypothetical protein